MQGVPNLAEPLQKQLKLEKKELQEKEKRLNTLLKRSKINAKVYAKKKDILKRGAAELEDHDLKRYGQGKVGKPSVDVSQPGIIDCLKNIVQANLAGADGRRRSEVIHTVRTLEELKTAVEAEGYTISKSGIYYQLLPRDATTIEGRSHHSLLKVRLLKA